MINKGPFQCYNYSCAVIEGNQTSKPASVSTLNRGGGINIGITRVIITVIFPIGHKFRLFNCFSVFHLYSFLMYNYFFCFLFVYTSIKKLVT